MFEPQYPIGYDNIHSADVWDEDEVFDPDSAYDNIRELEVWDDYRGAEDPDQDDAS